MYQNSITAVRQLNIVNWKNGYITLKAKNKSTRSYFVNIFVVSLRVLNFLNFEFQLFSLFLSELWWCHCCPSPPVHQGLLSCEDWPNCCVQDVFNLNLYSGLLETLALLLSSLRPLHMFSLTVRTNNSSRPWDSLIGKGTGANVAFLM